MTTKIFPHSRYNQVVTDAFHRMEKLAKLKGGEYSGDTDRLLNFRRNAEALGIPMETVWAVYAAKHWDALMQYIKDIAEGKSRERLEGIGGRVDDLLVYLMLFRCMLEEKETAGPFEAPAKIMKSVQSVAVEEDNNANIL